METTEYAVVENNDVESLTCVCGNSSSDEGLIQADSDGVPVHIEDSTPVPAGLSEWPEDEDELYTLCPICGRVYHDKTIKDTGEAPVAFVADLKEGPIAYGIRVHWNLYN